MAAYIYVVCICGESGFELWLKLGDPQGGYLVADICKGVSSRRRRRDGVLIEGGTGNKEIRKRGNEKMAWKWSLDLVTSNNGYIDNINQIIE